MLLSIDIGNSYIKFAVIDDSDNIKYRFSVSSSAHRSPDEYAMLIKQFLTDCNDFEESHTGLEDVKIEKEILKYCISQNPEIDGRLWAD